MRASYLLLLLIVAGAPLHAQEGEPEPAQEAATDAEAKAPATQETAPATKRPENREREASPQRFEPTEKVRADFDVSFPVDI